MPNIGWRRRQISAAAAPARAARRRARVRWQTSWRVPSLCRFELGDVQGRDVPLGLEPFLDRDSPEAVEPAADFLDVGLTPAVPAVNFGRDGVHEIIEQAQ